MTNEIPDYQAIMLPLLKFAGDSREHSLREAIEHLAGEFDLTQAQRGELLPSGRQATFDNRVGWARTYLKKAGLLNATRRGYFEITDRGKTVLDENPHRITRKNLMRFPSFVEFQTAQPAEADETGEAAELDTKTPEERIERFYQSIREELASELLEMIKTCSPSFFEKLVVDLLVRMGYGGTRRDAGKAIGRSGDGGIDGIINEDRLGLDVVYLQAKRWENTVPRPEIQKFAGALQGQRARKGVFITTSTFSSGATEYVSKIESKIVLIDGPTLADLMIDFELGVSTFATYALKRVDSDYFTDG